MIKERYYSEMLERYFDSKESALHAEDQEVQYLLALMSDLKDQYKKLRKGMRKAYVREMLGYKKKLMKSELVTPMKKKAANG